MIVDAPSAIVDGPSAYSSVVLQRDEKRSDVLQRDEKRSDESNWVIGNKGEACDSVCAKTNRSCNSTVQSYITDQRRFEYAMKQAGHQSCQRFLHRPYSGAPLIANDGNTCVYLTPRATSVCDEVKHPDHQPLCYCEINCGSPGILTNGWLEGKWTTLHAEIGFHCNDGYSLEGPSYTICQADGRWSCQLPRCHEFEDKKEAEGNGNASESGDNGDDDNVRKLEQRVEELENKVENKVLYRCSKDSDCGGSLNFCIAGWCSMFECTSDSDCESPGSPSGDNVCIKNICSVSTD